jgi:hypothetical protein
MPTGAEIVDSFVKSLHGHEATTVVRSAISRNVFEIRSRVDQQR